MARRGGGGADGRTWRPRKGLTEASREPGQQAIASQSTGKPASTPPGSADALPPALYLVATPIGNAADISLRALAVLRAADVIACEDTRVTAKLLAIHGVSRPLTACHDHNEATAAAALVARVAAGERVAFVSDAGAPLISDPGYRLARAAIEAGVPLVPVPGASAVLAALAVSGLPTDRFFFAGFLPPKADARRRAIADLAPIPSTLVLFESARRLAATLADLAEGLGPRPAVIARELTKRFEEIRRGRLPDLAQQYAGAPAPKGEVTLVVGPPAPAPAASAEQTDARLREALASQTPSEAAATVAADLGLPRRVVYARALALSGRR